jgi:protein tyrosine phosphatase (PTP) superfamily phosphohydrolase (DUF442 family)
MTLASFGLSISMPAAGTLPPDEEAPPIIVIPNVRIPVEGVITGGQPTPEMLKSASGYGYSTIVDLRGEGEDRGFDERALVESLGMRYVSIPISGASDLTEEHARELDEALNSSGTDGGLIMVHCGSGSRVGALFALKAHYVDGVSPEEAIDFGVEAGMTTLSGAVRAELGLAPEVGEASATEP